MLYKDYCLEVNYELEKGNGLIGKSSKDETLQGHALRIWTCVQGNIYINTHDILVQRGLEHFIKESGTNLYKTTPKTCFACL